MNVTFFGGAYRTGILDLWFLHDLGIETLISVFIFYRKI